MTFYRKSYASKDADSAVVAILVVIGAFFLLPLVGVLTGAFCGWIVGVFFPETILGTLACFGVKTEGLEVWQLGACLGFVGGFFKTSLSKKDG